LCFSIWLILYYCCISYSLSRVIILHYGALFFFISYLCYLLRFISKCLSYYSHEFSIEISLLLKLESSFCSFVYFSIIFCTRSCVCLYSLDLISFTTDLILIDTSLLLSNSITSVIGSASFYLFLSF